MSTIVQSAAVEVQRHVFLGFTGATGAVGPGYQATSASTNTIALGSKSFVTQTGLAYAAGVRVRVTALADPTSMVYMEGAVTNYVGDTIVVNLPGVKDQAEAVKLVQVTGKVYLRPVLSACQIVDSGATTTTVAGATTVASATTVAGAARAGDGTPPPPDGCREP